MENLIHEKLRHLTMEQIEELINEYYSQKSISYLLEKYQIKVRNSELMNLFPPEIIPNAHCKYCKAQMYRIRVSRSSLNTQEPSLCFVCNHRDTSSCSCKSCQNIQREKVKTELEIKVAAIRENYNIESRAIDRQPNELTLKEALFLLAFFFLSPEGDADTVSPIRELRALSPTAEFDSLIINTLRQHELIRVDPNSSIDAFVFENGALTNSYYSYRVSWILTIGENNLEASEFITELQSIVKTGNWPLDWYPDIEDLWCFISLHECLQILEYQADQHDLVAPSGEKTRLLFQDLLTDFSVAQIQNFIWRAVKDAVAYKVREKINRTHAGNSIITYCRNYAEKARLKKWEIKPFGRDHSCPRTAISDVLHNLFLKHDEDSHSMVCHPITPEYLDPDGTFMTDNKALPHFDKKNCEKLEIKLDLFNVPIELGGTSDSKLASVKERACLIREYGFSYFYWRVNIHTFDGKTHSELVQVGEYEFPASFSTFTVDDDLLTEAGVEACIPESWEAIERIISRADTYLDMTDSR